MRSDRSVGKGNAPGFFEDMRVLEIGGPAADFCGMLLAGEGADVIKIEPPEGSPSRGIGPFYQDVAGPDRSLFFWTYNRGKRAMCLDLDAAAGQQRCLELLRNADVIIDARNQAEMADPALSSDAVRAHNPSVVHCAITPFGRFGPWRDFKSSDLIHQALGGSAYCIGYDQKGDGTWDTPPFMAQAWHSYAIAAEHAVVAIAAAFYHARLTGRGQFIDAAIHDACAQATEGTVPRYIYTRRNQVRSTPQQLLCADGRHVAIVVTMLRLANQAKLRALLAPAGLDRELDDPRFADSEYLASLEANNRIAATLAKWAIHQTADAAFHALQACNIVCAPNRPPEELPADPQCRARNDFVQVAHPELDREFIYPRHPNLRSECAFRLETRAPLLGEHDGADWRVPPR